MILEIHDWKFDVDLTATMAHSASEAADHCDCAYCRNFYASVDSAYPELHPFLAQFGVDIEAPEELMPFEATNVLCCYAVAGKIVSFGSSPIRVNGAAVYAESPQDAMINVRCTAPYFILSAGPMDLPWVLDEPREDVKSPANEPSFLKRMWNKLFGRGSAAIS